MTKTPKKKIKVATTSLAGCFGCHMSLLDIDLALIDLLPFIEWDKSPLTDIKEFRGPVDVGIIEGGVCNQENLHVLKNFRKHCHTLVSVGACAITGGLPALRNEVPLSECLREAYLSGSTVHNPTNVIPHHKDLPKILDRVYPCHEIVKIDLFLPGCPPPSGAFRALFKSIIEDKPLQIPEEFFKYD